MKRQGRKSKAQTPAPKSERIKGSSKNPTGTASSKKSAESIKFSPEIISVLEKKKDEYNKKHESKVSLATLKAVFRRGAGAYSSSHRPTITGGMPNSRTAWAYARVNAFLRKKSGGYAKKSYVQDDDLMEEGGVIKSNDMKLLAPNGKPSNLNPEQYRLVRTPSFKAWFGDWEKDPENASKVVDDNGEPLVVYHGTRIDFTIFDKEKVSRNNKWGTGFYFTDDYEYAKSYANSRFNPIKDKEPLNVFLNIRDSYDIHKSSTHTEYVVGESENIKLADGSNVTFDPNNPDIRYEKGGQLNDLINQGIVELKMFNTTPEHAKEYGFNSKNPLYLQSIYISKDYRLKSIGSQVFEHIIDYAEKNEHDLIFGHITQKAEPNINVIKKILNDKGFNTIDGNNDFYKIIDTKYSDGGRLKSTEIEILEKNWFMDMTDTYAKGGDLPVGRLAKGMSLSEVAEYHGLKASDLKNELVEGIKTEMEHTTTPEIARAIALDHLYENPKYYTRLKEIENQPNKYAEGGNISSEYSFKTPTGEKSKLSYLQQVLVRTKGFKQFFGDWELAAENFLSDGRQNFEKYYKNVSKVIDYVTLEPRVVYHGTRTEEEFFTFDVTQDKIAGRPYGYFAYNKEYSENFFRGGNERNSFLYNCFLNVRNPFYATDSNFRMKVKDAAGWKESIYERIALDRYGTLEDTAQIERLNDVLDTQVGMYINKVFDETPYNFWLLMARDTEKDFKVFLITYGYDGVFYDEQFTDPYDPNNPKQHTNAITIFNANQVKLADGRNLNFDPLNNDIRYDDGGVVESENTQKTDNMSKKSMLRETLFGSQKFAEGGTIKTNQGKTDDGKKGGYFSGRSHAEGGIKAINVDTGELIEVEGQEVIITKDAVNDPKKRLFEGKMMTNKEILSKINQSGGGVSFAEGGEVSGGHCGCSGKKYNFGGQLLTDFDILNTLSTPQRIIEWEMNLAKSFMDDLTIKMK